MRFVIYNVVRQRGKYEKLIGILTHMAPGWPRSNSNISMNKIAGSENDQRETKPRVIRTLSKQWHETALLVAQNSCVPLHCPTMVPKKIKFATSKRGRWVHSLEGNIKNSARLYCVWRPGFMSSGPIVFHKQAKIRLDPERIPTGLTCAVTPHYIT